MNNESKIILTEYKGFDAAFFFDGNDITNLILDKKKNINVNDIYIGRVSNVKKDLKACFVEIQPGVNGFLPFENIVDKSILKSQGTSEIKQGDLVLVQVTKDKIKSKEYALSMDISIPGKYSVITLYDKKIHYSAKLNSGSIGLLNDFFCEKSYPFGFIIRTNASNASISLIQKEIENNSLILSDISDNASSRVAFSKLFSGHSALYEQISGIDEKTYSEIITDSKALFSEFDRFNKIIFYKDEFPLKALFSFDKAFALATEKKVYLKSGGFLVIEPTEALTVIDVNSGKYDKKADKEKLIMDTNNEAVVEICRQLMLRNLSGIIIVDFINISNKEDRDNLISLLKHELKKDRYKASFVDMTGLGLVEITREKKYSSIYDVLKNND